MVFLACVERPLRTRPVGRQASIREVSLIGIVGIQTAPRPGESIARAGRTYRVAAVDGGEYVHVEPSDSGSL